jgi:hypothetical protein
MLPTMEILKERHLDIYDQSWLCAKCDCADETFSHVWKCPITWTRMKDIIQDSQRVLQNLIQNNNPAVNVSNLPIWHMSTESSSYLQALIKGMIPQSLYNFIQNAMGSKNLTYAVLSAFMQFIFEQSQVIWTDRCSHQITFKKSRNINLKTKKEHTVATGYKFISSATPVNINNSIHDMVRFGSHWLNFWCRSGQALSHSVGDWNMIFLA